MNNLNFGVFCLIAGLWSFALAACAIVSGAGLLAFVAGSALVLWCYWRLVVSKPRYVVAGAWEWRRFGSREIYMEVA